MHTSLTSILLANATVLLVVCGLYVYHVNPRFPINRALCALCLLLATGCLGETIVFGTTSRTVCVAAWHVAWFGWAFYPAFALVIAIMITEHDGWLKNRWGAFLLFLPGTIIFLVSTLTLLGVREFTRTSTGNFIPQHTYLPWDMAYSYYQYTFDLLALGMIAWWGLSSGKNRKRYQALAILTGAILALSLDILRYFGGPNGELSALWGFELVVFAAGLVFSVTYHRFVTPTIALATDYILQHINDLVILLSTDGIILGVNPVVEQAVGRSTRALVGQPVTVLFHPDDAGVIHHCLALAPECTGAREARLQQPAGEAFPIALHYEILIDRYQDTIGAVLVGRDLRQTKQLEQEIAARTASEEALRRSRDELESLVQQRTAELAKANADLVREEELYRGIFESIQDVYFRMDLNGVLLMVSPSVYPISGYTPEEMIGRTVTDLGADPARFHSTFLRMLKEDGHIEDYEVSLLGKDDDKIVAAIHAHIVCDPATAEPVAIEGTMRDITSRTDAEEALRNSQAMLVRAQRIAGIGSWEMNLESERVLWSPQMYELYGLNPDSFLPTFQNCMSYVLPEDRGRLQEKLDAVLQHGTHSYDEHRILTPGGVERTMLTHGELIRDQHGRPERLVGITMDVTERKTAEETILQHQEALRSLALELSLTQERERRRLAVDLHDQISQPLVLANMQLKGLGKQSSDPTFSTALAEVAGRLEQLIKLTSTLTFELSPPILYELGFLAAVEWLAEEMQRQYHLHVAVRHTGAPPELDSELRIVLFRVVQELLMNVVKHALAREATIDVEADGEHISVTVADEGCGFLAGQSHPPDKTGGFGLFSIRERMQYFGGQLHITSTPGQGTQVIINLPLHAGATEKEFA